MGHKDKHHKDKKKQHKEKHHHKHGEKKNEKERNQDWDTGKEECQTPNYHKMHMCVLKHMGQMQLFDELSSDPTHRCSRCGCVSNVRKNLCQPYEL